MKRFIVFILLICLIFSCKSISDVAMKPVKDKKTGNLAGKIQFTINRAYWGLFAGTYTNNIMVIIKNKKTNRKYTASTQFGYYIFYNLPAGDYTFDSWKYMIEVTAKSSENDPGSAQFLLDKIKGFDFSIEDKVFKTMKNIVINVDVPKALLDKNNYYTRFEDEDMDELKDRFVKKDAQGLYGDYKWEKQMLSMKEEQATQSVDVISERYFVESDSDYYTMEQMYKKSDYYLSFVLFHRIVINMIKGMYVKKVDMNVPETEDLLELSKKANIKLTADQSIFLNDLSTLNERIRNGDTDENFQTLFVKNYFDKYLKKMDEFRKYMKDLKK